MAGDGPDAKATTDELVDHGPPDGPEARDDMEVLVCHCGDSWFRVMSTAFTSTAWAMK